MAKFGRFVRACGQVVKQTLTTIIFVGTAITLLAAGALYVDRVAGHNRTTEHGTIKGQPVLIIRESTHHLYVAIWVLAMTTALSLATAIYIAYKSRESDGARVVPTQTPGGIALSMPGQIRQQAMQSDTHGYVTIANVEHLHVHQVAPTQAIASPASAAEPRLDVPPPAEDPHG